MRLWNTITAPLRRIWSSDDPFDDYSLVHMTSAAGDAMVALALADSIFFSLPIGEAKVRVALYLGLTMAPLALAAPLLVPVLDRSRARRAVSFGSGLGRAGAAFYLAPLTGSLLLFPISFAILMLSRAHALTKNGLTAAYASGALVHANARLGRRAVAGVAMAMGPAFLLLHLGGPGAVLQLAAFVYLLSSIFSLSLRQPPDPPPTGVRLMARGRVAELARAAAGTAGLRAAHGFLIFLLAFALRRAGNPIGWFGALMGAGVAGSFIADLLAPRLPASIREERILLLSLLGAGAAALGAFSFFALGTLAVFTAMAGAATRFGQLAFASLMQRSAPSGAHGRVFVRYEVLFQLSWVAGAFVPAMLAVSFRPGVLALAVFYLTVGTLHVVRPRRRTDR